MGIRKNVWDLDEWAPEILWYARGVAKMKARPAADPLSWRYFAAIHGYYDFLFTPEELPSQDEIDRFWDQCQHATWYFLPWHRGYIHAWEQTLRAEIVQLEGPADWAVPYWNYFKPGQDGLPKAFVSPNWPDGEGNNPLFETQRFGTRARVESLSLNALKVPVFTSRDMADSFGGGETGFAHFGQFAGHLESDPHNNVHGDVGRGGLMSDPGTAALDPIFWLHHANIDRLWQVWLQAPNQNHANPAEDTWRKGPASLGEREFVMPFPGSPAWIFAPEDVVDLAALDTSYDDVAAPPQPAGVVARLRRLGASPEAIEMLGETEFLPADKETSVIGASPTGLKLQENGIRTAVRLDTDSRRELVGSLEALTAIPAKVFLNLENITGQHDPTSLMVYVGVQDAAVPSHHPKKFAGRITLFGVSRASLADGPHGGTGLNFALDITDILDDLYLKGELHEDQLTVALVPMDPVPETADVTVGRISIVRQPS